MPGSTRESDGSKCHGLNPSYLPAMFLETLIPVVLAYYGRIQETAQVSCPH